MALNAQEQELLDFAIAALPKWFTSDERCMEELRGFAKVFGDARATIEYWLGQTFIGGANGPDTGLPDWANQQAVDLGTRRQANESTPALRYRLQHPADAVIPAAIIAATNAILVADGVTGTCAMVELPRDGAYLGVHTAMSGTGGAFAQAGAASSFTPTTLPWPAPPYRNPGVMSARQHQLVITGAGSAGNDGTFPITGLTGDAAIYMNPAGAAGADPTVSWTVQRLDELSNVRDGHARAYLSRGYRIMRLRPMFILILPYGTTEGTASGVREMLRLKKAAGFKVLIERRTSP